MQQNALITLHNTDENKLYFVDFNCELFCKPTDTQEPGYEDFFFFFF